MPNVTTSYVPFSYSAASNAEYLYLTEMVEEEEGFKLTRIKRTRDMKSYEDVADIPEHRRDLCMTILHGGEVFIAGGKELPYSVSVHCNRL